MYSNKLASAIKVGGKVLREFNDTVYVPFGSEYSILIKNLNTVRALIDVFIDGENAVPGGLVLNSGQEIDLERWIKNGNLSEGNRFKFIERTNAVAQHRGIKLEDGLIRIEYQFEKAYPFQQCKSWYNSFNTMKVTDSPSDYFYGLAQNSTVNMSLGSSILRSTAAASKLTTASVSNNINSVTTSANDAGITVPGSKSDQKFSTASWFPTEPEKHTLIFKLLGETEENKMVSKPITVKHKPKCITCGKQNKATAKFCNSCGTALEIFA